MKVEEKARKFLIDLNALSADKLCEWGCKDKATAMIILSNKNLYKKLGKYLLITPSMREHSPMSFWTQESYQQRTADYFLKLGTSHPEIAQHILKTPELKKRISPDQAEKLSQITFENAINFSPQS